MMDVLISLIGGSIRYSGESAVLVCMSVGIEDDGPVFFTRCEGKWDLNDLSQAFKLFSGERTDCKFTSIDLAISRKITGLQGGRMWVECGPEIGWPILFTLPEGKDE